MKKLLFIVVLVGLLTNSFSGNTEQISTSGTAKVKATKTNTPTKVKSCLKVINCNTDFVTNCNGGNPLVVLPGEIVDALDAIRFCATHQITCTSGECAARIDVLFGFVAPDPNPLHNSCLPAGF